MATHAVHHSDTNSDWYRQVNRDLLHTLIPPNVLSHLESLDNVTRMKKQKAQV